MLYSQEQTRESQRICNLANYAMSAPTFDSPEAEIKYLKEQISELEQALFEQAEKTNQLVADAQRKTYWLERWHIDLNQTMRRPITHRIRASLRAGRSVFRIFRKAVRKKRDKS